MSYFYAKRQVLDDGIHTKPLDVVLTPWIDKKYDVIDETHPLSLTKAINVTIDGREYKTLADVCQDALKQENPPELIKECLKQLPRYVPQGEVNVSITSALRKLDYKFWKNETYWTTGLSAKATPLRDQHPGQNMLGKLIMETIDSSL